ncbi:interferon-induced GTP-binding protein Mx2 isoform X2 [Phacochoerus africanus]|uniref:interferon-induced GTP-binding protein Mx2 isoform X2 n=1 Tax=Phacochoerus africanus TaxID=41426 RepID=UPI001FDACA5A|nr:interferon-induced GTP-binding protein Mx2 isoform X2 [Phacochoerus africanus]
MPKPRMSWPYQRHRQASSPPHPHKEMNFFPQQPLPLGAAPGQMTFPLNWQMGGKDLTKGLNMPTLSPQQPGGKSGQQTSKGPENNLYSPFEEKVRPCIDLIDSLRALGVEQDLALPTIAVIGDQSSGKSSVLEALSGVPLPRGSGIITRCPLALRLKKKECPWQGRISYRKVELQLQDPSQVEREIRKAQDAIAGSGVGISHELISLEVTSPEVPDLTLIDLPGITRVAVGNQPQDIGLQIKALIKKYIQEQQTINLVVVPCNVDIATTEALRMAQEVDPEGDRTIGILTKPDLVDKGAEKVVLNVMQNLTYHLKKGYMIVKCRGQQEILNKLSLAEATKREIAFFRSHPHFRILLEEGKATVPRLAERLTIELIWHISKSLPLLISQIKEIHQSATEELRLCGASVPSNEADKMFFLIEKIKVFNQDIENLVEGEEIVKGKETRLYNKIREEFKSWIVTLDCNAQKETVQQTFSDTAQKNFGEFCNLNQTTQNKVESITAHAAERAEGLIRLQFRMEQLVFCQDDIYRVDLTAVREELFNPVAEHPQNLQLRLPFVNGPSPVSSLTEIGVHVNAYFMGTSQRLANQIPFIIQYCVLQESRDHLQKAMMQMLHGREHYSWLLQEESHTSAKRNFLKEKIHRLAEARHALSKFAQSLQG